jgi:hypothetical protein
LCSDGVSDSRQHEINVQATLEITVTEVTIMCDGRDRMELLLQTKEGHEKGRWNDDGSMTFDVPFELRPDRAGVIQPWGDCVQRQPDGRRFVYLVWFRTKGAEKSSVGRLKVFFDRVPGFPGANEFYSLRVLGRDPKGRPACATARLAPNQ